ncbi:pantothenate kinase [Listeria cornellensis FSL F6-0969]|uniref:pantothenate kinase n=1 Tax=Listeria cornellensis FSL F6-0969 TaxID=1265820 RepID=W7CD54_9LIST|nr:pantothenate kinase [Listeria cornellensis FSL F6-0969]
MILVIDVGNTNITIGVYEGKELRKHWRMTTDRHRTSDELGMMVLDFFSVWWYFCKGYRWNHYFFCRTTDYAFSGSDVL